LEVAEHLPAECAGALVDSLCRLAPVVAFSAAIPFQGGVHHVNERWPEYWAALFEARGFVVIDCLRRDLWQDERVEWWYAQNLLLYARSEHVLSHRALAREHAFTNRNALALVHPRRFLQAIAAIHHLLQKGGGPGGA
jgi:hypothetical protein